MLYSEIHLTNSNLKAINKIFNVTHVPLVRSLTITVDPVRLAQDPAGPYSTPSSKTRTTCINTEANSPNTSGLFSISQQNKNSEHGQDDDLFP